MSKSTLKVILLFVIYVTTNTIYCQTDSQWYQSELPLPKSAKLKMIRYDKFNYVAVGYVYENKFVEGQIITFFDTNDMFRYGYWPIAITHLRDTIISGVYHIKDGISYLEGKNIILKVGDDSLSDTIVSFSQGLFQVTNNEYQNGLTINPKKATNLNIKTETIYYYQGFYPEFEGYEYDDNDKLVLIGNPISLQKQSNNYILKIETEVDTFQAVVSPQVIKEYKYISPDSIPFDEVLCKAQILKLNYKNGDVYTGTIDKTENGDLKLQNGEYRYAKGEIYKGEHVNALVVVRKLAEQGDSSAQKCLGDVYYFGIDVPQNYSEALMWYRKAAEQGDASAQSDVGDMYYLGLGVQVDYNEAIKWFRKAVEQDDPRGQFRLAVFYLYGHGVTKDINKAAEWNAKAANQGYEPAKEMFRERGHLQKHGKDYFLFNNYP